MEYQVAWGIAMVAGLGLAGCAFFAFRKWRQLRWLVTVLVVVWSLMPWRFDDDPTHLAPAFVVLMFKLLFEPGADPGPVLTGMGLATAAVLVVFLVGFGLTTLRARRRMGSAETS